MSPPWVEASKPIALTVSSYPLPGWTLSMKYRPFKAELVV